MQNTLQRKENPTNYLPWLLGAGAVGFGTWYFFFREKDEEDDEEENGETGVVPDSAWGADDDYVVEVERDYTTFFSSSYPAANEWSVDADPSAIQINSAERVAGGFQIDFTPLKTGLHTIQITTEAGFGNPLLRLNVRSIV